MKKTLLQNIVLALSLIILTNCSSENSNADGGLDAGVVCSGDMKFVENPKTCAEAACSPSNVGCDFWPTVTPNTVWSIFHFAVEVANPQTMPVTVTVTGPKNFSEQKTIPAGGIGRFYLPWVPELKGDDTDTRFNRRQQASTLAKQGAYHLVSSLPVTAYQFSPIETEGVGGPNGTDWSACPAKTPDGGEHVHDASVVDAHMHGEVDASTVVDASVVDSSVVIDAASVDANNGDASSSDDGGTADALAEDHDAFHDGHVHEEEEDPRDFSVPPAPGCYSFMNEASMLLPSSAWGTKYMISSTFGEGRYPPSTDPPPPPPPYGAGSGVVITARQKTNVHFAIADHPARDFIVSNVVTGFDGEEPIVLDGGKSLDFTLEAGDAQLVVAASDGLDLVGCEITADQPVQVIAATAQTRLGLQAIPDHIEEIVLPLEAWDKNNLIGTPIQQDGYLGNRVLSLYGLYDKTNISGYEPEQPTTYPTATHKGDLFRIYSLTSTTDPSKVVDSSLFIGALKPIAMSIVFMPLFDDQPLRGGATFSIVTPMSQYRTTYVFSAPPEYPNTYIEVMSRLDATFTLDGQTVSQDQKAIGFGSGVVRLKVDTSRTGAHKLVSTQPASVQVFGYGPYGGYAYPAGMNVKLTPVN